MTLAEILAEARAAVAAGRAPDWASLRERIRSAPAGDRERREAAGQLERIAAVHRARTARARTVERAAAAPPRRTRSLARSRPTITGNLDVRRARSGGDYVLVWEADRTVTAWEVRISERRDVRGDYELLEERSLPAEATSLELPLGDAPLRVHLHGRGRGGRLLRRAILSGLVRESWDERWQRRPSAA